MAQNMADDGVKVAVQFSFNQINDCVSLSIYMDQLKYFGGNALMPVASNGKLYS